MSMSCSDSFSWEICIRSRVCGAAQGRRVCLTVGGRGAVERGNKVSERCRLSKKKTVFRIHIREGGPCRPTCPPHTPNTLIYTHGISCVPAHDTPTPTPPPPPHTKDPHLYTLVSSTSDVQVLSPRFHVFIGRAPTRRLGSLGRPTQPDPTQPNPPSGSTRFAAALWQQTQRDDQKKAYNSGQRQQQAPLLGKTLYLGDFEVRQRRALGPLLVVGPSPPQHLQKLRVELLPQLGHVLAPKKVHLR